MELSVDLEKFIQTPQFMQNLGQNNFSQIYQEAEDELTPSSVADLTMLFLSFDIHPLQYMESVPINYALGVDFKELPFNLPDGIREIQKFSFYRSENITEVYVPDGVWFIGPYSFGAINSLQKVSLPSSVTTVGHRVFESCHNLKEIEFRGTTKQLDQVAGAHLIRVGTPVANIKCSDGLF